MLFGSVLTSNMMAGMNSGIGQAWSVDAVTATKVEEGVRLWKVSYSVHVTFTFPSHFDHLPEYTEHPDVCGQSHYE